MPRKQQPLDAQQRQVVTELLFGPPFQFAVRRRQAPGLIEQSFRVAKLARAEALPRGLVSAYRRAVVAFVRTVTLKLSDCW